LTLAQEKITRPYSKYKLKAKELGGMAQVMESLCSKLKALSSILSTTKKKKRKSSTSFHAKGRRESVSSCK
jgi:hypothetical protein